MSQAPVDFTRVRAVLFDCYDTLLDISTDEKGLSGYQTLSTWAAYQGVRIAPEELRDEYRQRIAWTMAQSTDAHPEVRVEEIFAGICRDYAAWPVDETILGVLFARSFRAATVRKLGAFPRSRRLLSALYGYPLGVVSNGQRVFSEVELRMFGLAPFFTAVVFSSDVGCKKPDDRIFQVALRRLGVEAEEALFIGDSMTNDILPARRLGMQAIPITKAWPLFSI
jgi:putative hydrolase of the HAD superfamily